MVYLERIYTKPFFYLPKYIFWCEKATAIWKSTKVAGVHNNGDNSKNKNDDGNTIIIIIVIKINSLFQPGDFSVKSNIVQE